MGDDDIIAVTEKVTAAAAMLQHLGRYFGRTKLRSVAEKFSATVLAVGNGPTNVVLQRYFVRVLRLLLQSTTSGGRRRRTCVTVVIVDRNGIKRRSQAQERPA